MHFPNLAISPTRPWWRDVGSWILVLAFPGLVASQWLALRVLPGARTAFNATLLAAVAIVLVARRSSLVRERWLTAAGGALIATLALSVIFNEVSSPAVLLRGSMPYLFPLAVGVAAVVWHPTPGVVSAAVITAAVVIGVVAVAAVIQLILGETGFRITGQELDYPRWWERGRATGLLVNPGRLAHVGLVGVMLAPMAGRWRWLLAVGGGVAAAASGGRLVVVAVIALALMAVAARRWSGRTVLLGGLLVTTLAFALFQLIIPAAREDLAERLDTTIDGAAIDVRAENLDTSLQLIADRPLLGAGPGRFGSTTAFATNSELHDHYGLLDVRSEEFVAELRQKGDLREIDVGTAQLDIGVLQIATELGLLGVAATAAFAIGLLRQAIKARSLVALGLLVLLGIFSVTGPGWVDASLAGTLLWWMGATSGRDHP